MRPARGEYAWNGVFYRPLSFGIIPIFEAEKAVRGQTPEEISSRTSFKVLQTIATSLFFRLL